jgi:hypothetical protein
VSTNYRLDLNGYFPDVHRFWVIWSTRLEAIVQPLFSFFAGLVLEAISRGVPPDDRIQIMALQPVPESLENLILRTIIVKGVKSLKLLRWVVCLRPNDIADVVGLADALLGRPVPASRL